MDFTITDEQKALRDAVRGALGRHASPAAEQNRSAAPPPLDETVWNALVEMGVPALPWSEEDGGVGAGVVDVAVAATEVGRARVQVPLAEVIAAGVMIRSCAEASRRAELLGAISEGSVVVPALAEPMRAWASAPQDVTASRSGDAWELSGTKAPVRYAPAATHLVVSARTDSGTALFLVEGGADSEQVEFDRRPAELLSEQADEAIATGLAVGGAVLCNEAVGAMDAALRMTTEYLKTREQFGRPLAAFQTLTQRAADMYAQVELARSSALYAALVSDGDDDGAVSVDDILRARVVVDKAARHVGREAIQLHGGIGVTAEYPVGHLAARLGDITRTWGDARSHLRTLGGRIADHRSVEVLA